MKWLFPTIVGGLVLALGISISGWQIAASGWRIAAARAQQTAASNDAAPDAPERADKRPLPAADALPVSSDSAAEKAQAGNPDAELGSQFKGPPKKLIFEVQHRAAASLVELMKRMYPKTRFKIYADPRNNWLIFPDGAEQNFLTILELLDQPASKKTFDPASGADNAALTPQAQGRMMGSGWQSAPTDATSPPEAQEFREYESQALELAQAYRQQQATSPQDAKRLDQLRAELQGAIHSAFHARQAWQQLLAAQLRTRLEQIERRIADRGQMASEIIQRRIEELLHPEQQWEQENDAGAALQEGILTQEPVTPLAIVIEGNKSIKTEEIMKRIKTRADRVIDARQLKEDVRALISTRWFFGVGTRIENSSQGPALIFSVAERSVVPDDGPIRSGVEGRPGEFLADGAANPRKGVLDAADAVTTARAAIVEAKEILANSEDMLKAMQSVVQGAIPKKQILDAEREMRRNRAAVQRMVVDLDIKERQLEDGRPRNTGCADQVPGNRSGRCQTAVRTG